MSVPHLTASGEDPAGPAWSEHRSVVEDRCGQESWLVCLGRGTKSGRGRWSGGVEQGQGRLCQGRPVASVASWHRIQWIQLLMPCQPPLEWWWGWRGQGTGQD